MVKRTVALDGRTGKAFEVTKAMQKSQKGAIPWTRGPDTIGRKIARNPWG